MKYNICVLNYMYVARMWGWPISVETSYWYIELLFTGVTLTFRQEESIPASSRHKLNSSVGGDSPSNNIKRTHIPGCSRHPSTAALSSLPVESHTMAMPSERPNALANNRNKHKSFSRSNSSPEKSPSKHLSQPLLPPSANQALRTALWVKAVTNEMSSLDENSTAHLMTSFESDKTKSPSNDSHIIRAEINHKPSPSSSRQELITLTKLGADNSNSCQHLPTKDSVSIELTTTQVWPPRERYFKPFLHQRI